MDKNYNPFLENNYNEENAGLFDGIFGTEEDFEQFKKEYIQKQKELKEFIDERKN